MRSSFWCDKCDIDITIDTYDDESEDDIMDINVIAYNAIDYMLCEGEMTIEEVCNYIGCTEEDLRYYGLIKEDE